jgi:hydroxyacylglutathione hydrolase
MEELNVQGASLLGALPVAKPLSAPEFVELAADAWVVDTRMPLSFAAAHVPGAVALWKKELPTYAGWFLDYDRPILLVADQPDLYSVIRYLVRMGFDQIAGYLVDGMLGWHRAGLESRSLRTVTVQQLCHLLDTDRNPAILDVRSAEEVTTEAIPGAQHIYIKELPERMDEISGDREVYVFCGSGVRSVIVSSLMRRAGRDNMTVVLGGLSGWNSSSCPLPLD